MRTQHKRHHGVGEVIQELRSKQSSLQRLSAKYAKYYLAEKGPKEMCFVLIGLCHLLIRKIPQKDTREALTREVTRTFFNSFKRLRRCDNSKGEQAMSPKKFIAIKR